MVPFEIVRGFMAAYSCALLLSHVAHELSFRDVLQKALVRHPNMRVTVGLMGGRPSRLTAMTWVEVVVSPFHKSSSFGLVLHVVEKKRTDFRLACRLVELPF